MKLDKDYLVCFKNPAEVLECNKDEYRFYVNDLVCIAGSIAKNNRIPDELKSEHFDEEHLASVLIPLLIHAAEEGYDLGAIVVRGLQVLTEFKP